MRQVGVPLQRQSLLKRLLVTSHIFGFLGVILSIALLAMGMTAGGLTVLGITLATWAAATLSARHRNKNQF
ncbi:MULTISPECIES: hypothetical protein [Streptomyces]|uniref:Uncharacterized protein n=2 Tax=Streptomyces TaxID=1883 RepID=A0ABQ3BGA5_9ACTN|nr:MULTISPECIES: hypothetical protein [Streptomyces]MBM7057384.1 hypothetical protein [Streptomyces durocortorensis]MYX04210.1 hypothetical protein [Streptomyces sp. SID8378]RUP68285.1 hypothetical protein SSPNP10_12695 [Streptomyces sp. NP10]WST53109.1 hypothetical protein OG475_09605 [Streptomyces rubiginosohelvolus]SNB90927.1 hypothetical protein SAMN02745831_07244 [Streptomyces sp. PgraA7]